MKKHKRIEITAFRRRVLIFAGEPVADMGETDVEVTDVDSQDTIETASEEGQKILIDAMRLLKRSLNRGDRET